MVVTLYLFCLKHRFQRRFGLFRINMWKMEGHLHAFWLFSTLPIIFSKLAQISSIFPLTALKTKLENVWILERPMCRVAIRIFHLPGSHSRIFEILHILGSRSRCFVYSISQYLTQNI